MNQTALHALGPGAPEPGGGRFLRRLEPRDFGLAAAAGALAFALYASTLAPTITGEDAGELCAAAYALGIPHPPGYPLYCLLGRAWISLVPIGDVALRLNALSAFFGAVAVGLLVLVSLELGAGSPAAFGAALLAAVSSPLWSQATIAEVYTLAAACLLAVFLVWIRFLAEPACERLAILAYAFGLALAAHPVLVLLAPGLLAGVATRSRSLLRTRAALAAAGAFLLGLSIYLYLPIRSLADPLIDWGDPETPAGFLAHVLRSQYSGVRAVAEGPWWQGLAFLARVLVVDVGPAVTALGVSGLRSLLRFPGEGEWWAERLAARRAFRRGYLIHLAALSAGLLFFLSVSFEKEILEANRVFFVPLILIATPAVARGLELAALWARALLAAVFRFRGAAAGAERGPPPPADAAPARVRAPARAASLAWAAALALPAALAALQYRAHDRSDYRIAREYAEHVLRTLPEGAVYLPEGDHAAFPVLYLQVVEGRRPDVAIASPYGYLDPSFLRRLGAADGDVERLRRNPRGVAERWVIDRSGRPVFVNSKRPILELPPERFAPFGLLYRVDRERRPLRPGEEAELWASYRFSNLRGDGTWRKGLRDLPGDAIAFEFLSHLADRHFSRGEREKGLAVARRLREVASGYKGLLLNAGSLLLDAGETERALECYEDALSIDPGYALCQRACARAYFKLGRNLARAVELAERSLAKSAPGPGFLKDLGKAYRALGRLGNARDALELAARLDPGDPEPSRILGEIAEETRGAEAARAYYLESLRRKPAQPELIERVSGREAREEFEKRAKAALDALAGAGIEAALGASGNTQKK